MLRNYFKYIFLEDYSLTPVEEKDIFKLKFPSILSGKDIMEYINTKYKEEKTLIKIKY